MATTHLQQTTIATPGQFEILLATGGKRVLGSALAKTVKARNYHPGQAQS